jgi:SAM-dependent methyltransferase
VNTLATPSRPRGLHLGHFRKIATRGFGDGCNSYCYSSAWFGDHLYVGTNRHMLAVVKKRFSYELPCKVWPVALPESAWDLDLRGQIWRYSPTTGEWQRAYRSPMVPGLEGHTVPLGSGFRNMGVFQGKSDPCPALYTIPGCSTYAVGPVVLRSYDGEQWDPISEPGLGIGDSNITAFRGVVPFKGRLFITPSASRGGNFNTSYHPTIYCTDDPAGGRWERSNESAFGDPTNHGIFDLGVCGNYLYAGTINIRDGCQLWRTDAEGPPPHRWVKVFDRGADRGPHNQVICCFAALGDVLYLGTGVQNGGHDHLNHIGPAAAEVIRVFPDDTWEVVVGEPRMTRFGFMVPRSGLGPGFDNPFTGYVWRMCVHDGAVYAGTYDSSSMFPFLDESHWSESSRRIFDQPLLERFMRVRGGCEVWQSSDGERWLPITRNGFGNPFNWGIRSMLSTPEGVFIGTSNPFGPKVAVRGPGGWHYEENPQGGVEVWHGHPAHAGSADGDPTDGSGPGLSGDDDALSLDLLAGRLTPTVEAWTELEADEPAEGNGVLVQSLVQEVRTAGEGNLAVHSIPWLTKREARLDRRDPLWRLSSAAKDLVSLSEDAEEELRGYFAGNLQNMGYWRSTRISPHQACEQLIEELLYMLPEKTEPGRVLAIGAGADELARYVTRRWHAAAVDTIEVPGWLGGTSHRNGWRKTPAERLPRLKAKNETYDLVLWIEGPSRIDRPTALAEARRVLRAEGCLLSADVVGDAPEDWVRPSRKRSHGLLDRPKAMDAYRQDLENTKLEAVNLADITRQTWFRFYRHSRHYVATKELFSQLDAQQRDAILEALPGGRMAVEAYVVCCARKK